MSLRCRNFINRSRYLLINEYILYLNLVSVKQTISRKHWKFRMTSIIQLTPGESLRGSCTKILTVFKKTYFSVKFSKRIWTMISVFNLTFCLSQFISVPKSLGHHIDCQLHEKVAAINNFDDSKLIIIALACYLRRSSHLLTSAAASICDICKRDLEPNCKTGQWPFTLA